MGSVYGLKISGNLGGGTVLRSGSYFVRIVKTQFNIVYTGTVDQLVFGEFGQDITTGRPTQLLFDAPYTRR